MSACRSGSRPTTSASRAVRSSCCGATRRASCPTRRTAPCAGLLVDYERVDLLTGIDFSSNAYAVGAVATQAKTPRSMNAASSGITARSPYMVRGLVHHRAQVTAAAGALGARARRCASICTVTAADYSALASMPRTPFVTGHHQPAAARRRRDAARAAGRRRTTRPTCCGMRELKLAGGSSSSCPRARRRPRASCAPGSVPRHGRDRHPAAGHRRRHRRPLPRRTSASWPRDWSPATTTPTPTSRPRTSRFAGGLRDRE